MAPALKKRVVLDIGTSAVRFCELTKTKTGLQVTRFAQREFNADPALDEEQRREVRSTAVRELLKEARVKRGKLVLAVPGQSVFTRSRTLPPVPEYRVNQIVRYEIQQQIPFGLDQIAMDYQVLGRSEQGGYDVLMAAIKVDVVDKHLEIVAPLKRSVAWVDIVPMAAYNWMRQAGEFGNPSECVALLNIGASTTDLIIERNGQFRFTRPIAFGGNDITRALAEAFNMDFATAEKLKRERAFAPTGNPQRDGQGGEVIGRVLQRLVTEVTRSFSYFRSLPGGGTVNRIILSGGGAKLKNLAPYLQRQWNMEVRPANVLNGLSVAPAAASIRDAGEQAAVVLGLALRCAAAAPLTFDLIPPRLVIAARRKEQAVYWALSVCAVILIFFSMVPAEHKKNQLVKQRIEELKNIIRAYDPELVQRIRPGSPPPVSTLNEQLAQRKAAVRQVENQVKALDAARRQRRFWMDELSLIADARPATGGIWFASVETTVVEDTPAGGQAPGPQPGRGGRQGTEGGLKTGFPGIQPPGGVTRNVGGRAAGGGPAAGARGPAGPGAPAAAAEIETRSQPIPNGMIVRGYAETDTAFKQFTNELKQIYRQLGANVYLSAQDVIYKEASIQPQPWNVLYNAPLAGGGTGGGGAAQQQGGGGAGILSFEVTVKFRRSPQPPARQEQQPNPGGGGA
ncbi:MAG TPA: type IV pilus assembly protein PilM [Candidatus Hydrogenedentes bacterium]|nr:type IV pilus assembly protein PilM [Candidatus Hydrogenedentota bacterium]